LQKIDELENSWTGSTNQNTIAPMMGGADQCVFTIIMSDTGSTEKDCNKISNDPMQEMCKTSIKIDQKWSFQHKHNNRIPCKKSQNVSFQQRVLNSIFTSNKSSTKRNASDSR